MGNVILTFMCWNSHNPAVFKPLAVVWLEYSYLNIVLAILSHLHARAIQYRRRIRHNDCWTGLEYIDLAFLYLPLWNGYYCAKTEHILEKCQTYTATENLMVPVRGLTLVQDDVILRLMGACPYSRNPLHIGTVNIEFPVKGTDCTGLEVVASK